MIRRLITPLISPVSALAVAFGIAALIVLASGGNPVEAFSAMFMGAFGSLSACGETIVKAIPLGLAGLAVALGLRCRLFNIGAEGQLLMGGLAAAYVGYALRLPGLIHIPVCLVAGALGGAVWAFLPGYLKAKRGVHEVITTIMLNYIAFYLSHYLVSGCLADRTSMAPQTPEIHQTAVLPSIGSAHWGILVAVLAVLGFAFLINKTVLGYEIRSVGLGPEASLAAGINLVVITILTMAVSGALAGIAGAVEVMGVHHRFYDQFSPGYGFDSIAVALLGNNSALGTSISALLFGALRNGSVSMQLVTETPKEVVTIIQAVVILVAGARFLKRHVQTPPT